jgi:hypothetical protein
MDHERMHEITAAMCILVDQQLKLLGTRWTLSCLSTQEMEVYVHWNDLLYQLSKRLFNE